MNTKEGGICSNSVDGEHRDQLVETPNVRFVKGFIIALRESREHEGHGKRENTRYRTGRISIDVANDIHGTKEGGKTEDIFEFRACRQR